MELPDLRVGRLHSVHLVFDSVHLVFDKLLQRGRLCRFEGFEGLWVERAAFNGQSAERPPGVEVLDAAEIADPPSWPGSAGQESRKARWPVTAAAERLVERAKAWAAGHPP